MEGETAVSDARSMGVTATGSYDDDLFFSQSVMEALIADQKVWVSIPCQSKVWLFSLSMLTDNIVLVVQS
jgi:hypothetical protein